MRYRIAIQILASLFFVKSYGHKHDSIPTDTQEVKFYFQLKEINSDQFRLFHVDTSIYRFQHLNPLNKTSFFYSQTGLIGSPFQNLKYEQAISFFNVFTGMQQFDHIRLTIDNNRIYQSNGSFTEAIYSMGPNREQLFDLYHNQKMFKKLDIGVNYRIMHALGNYFRQKTDDSQVSFYSKYESANKKYGFQLNYINNRLSFNENGGISYPGYFEDSLVLNRRIIPVNLEEADNTLKESIYQFQHYYNFVKKDIIEKDSIEIIKQKFIGRVYHSVNFSMNRQSYNDIYPLGGYYKAINYDTTNTFDSLTLKVFENIIGVSNFKLDTNGQNRVRFKGGLSYQYIEAKQNDNYYYYNQLKPFAFIGLRLSRGIDLRGYGELFIGGYKEGDFKILGEIDYHQKKIDGIKGKLNLKINLRQPGLFKERYFSNHFIWENVFNKEKIIELGFVGSLNGYSLKASIINTHDFVYFDTSAMPSQISSPIQVFILSISKYFKIGKFGNYNEFLFQNSSNKDVLRLPDLAGYNSLFYNFDLFKHNLKVQLGIDAIYTTAYYANAYMPATRQFYIQNEKKINTYAYVDVFANFKLKRARFFLKLEHINAGLFDYNYYTVPYYPMHDRIFRFGVAWKFYN